MHPQHLDDVLQGLATLEALGLTDGSYVLSGHSCGACLVLQATLQPPRHYGLSEPPPPARPAAVIGLNGLYDLPALVDGLDPSHAHLRSEYDMLLSNAFGTDQSAWPAASPARFDPVEVAAWVREGRAPKLVVLDQSTEDELVPAGQRTRMEDALRSVAGLRTVVGHRCTGSHAEPWEQGVAIWQSVQDALALLPHRS